jgi:hypothetical protein
MDLPRIEASGNRDANSVGQCGGVANDFVTRNTARRTATAASTTV